MYMYGKCEFMPSLFLRETKYACLLVISLCVFGLDLFFLLFAPAFFLSRPFLFFFYALDTYPSINSYHILSIVFPAPFSILIYCVIPASMAVVSSDGIVESSFTGMVNLRSSSMASCLASLWRTPQTESGLSDMESIPASARSSANPG